LGSSSRLPSIACTPFRHHRRGCFKSPATIPATACWLSCHNREITPLNVATEARRGRGSRTFTHSRSRRSRRTWARSPLSARPRVRARNDKPRLSEYGISSCDAPRTRTKASSNSLLRLQRALPFRWLGSFETSDDSCSTPASRLQGAVRPNKGVLVMKTRMDDKMDKMSEAETRGASHAVQEELLLRNLPILSHSMTFARMVRENAKFIPHFKDLGWLFPAVCHRKDQAVLTDTEKSRYICAFNMINNDGTLGQLVDIHGQMHMQHSNSRLLPWHRIFLYLYEEALHNYHPDVCIPYWDWTEPGEQHFPDWLVALLPTVHTPTQTINVIRSPGSSAQLGSIASGTPTAMAKTDYGQFSGPINGIHGGVHMWVGGTMSDASISPADPVFWLHHANLDRLWWMWYNSPQGNHQNPPLIGSDALMDPWSYTEADTRDIASLGYTYD
jgi:tyrosinase